MMRKQFSATSLVAASFVAGLTACDNDKLTQVNVNPNAAGAGPVAAALHECDAQRDVGNLRGRRSSTASPALWVQHYAEIQYAEADVNHAARIDGGGLWNTLYSGSLQDYTQILDAVGDPAQHRRAGARRCAPSSSRR